MVVRSKNMKIKKSHLKRIIREELQRESRFSRRPWDPHVDPEARQQARKDLGAVHGYGHGAKLRKGREQQRQAKETKLTKVNWDCWDHVAAAIWNEMYSLRQNYGHNLEKPTTHLTGDPNSLPLSQRTDAQLKSTFGTGPGEGKTALEALRLIKLLAPPDEDFLDKDVMRDMIKTELVKDPLYWDWTITRAQQSMGEFNPIPCLPGL